ncbi:MAG: hypothetical protein KBA51_01765 [Kiritimatiellae bacterium]|nr:hypothetical protein [Kiritimatiellia bacterium]
MRGVVTAGVVLGGALALGFGCSRGPADSGEPLDIRVALSTNSVRIGTPVSLQVTAFYPADARLDWIEPGSENLMTSRLHVSERKISKDRMKSVWAYRVLPVAVGSHAVFTGEVRTVSSAGAPLAAHRPDLTLRVESMNPDIKAPPRAMRGPLDPPDLVPRWVWVLPLVAILAALAGLAARLAARRVREAVSRGPPPLPPHEKALAALHALETSGVVDAEDPEPMFVQSSGIVRTYVEERFHVRAPELTTEEFLRAATDSSELTPAARTGVGRFLGDCDLVKFARHQPDLSARHAALNSAIGFVESTVPAEPAAPMESSTVPSNPDGRGA